MRSTSAAVRGSVGGGDGVIVLISLLLLLPAIYSMSKEKSHDQSLIALVRVRSQGGCVADSERENEK
jgi:hypothetical protein